MVWRRCASCTCVRSELHLYAAPALVAEFISRRCGVTLSRQHVAASHSQIAVAAARTLRRHTHRLLLRQQGRCSVTLAHCCCGSRDIDASSWQTAVASAGTLPVVVTHQFLRRSQRRACDEAPQTRGGVPDIASVFRGSHVVSHMPWWSVNPPLFQRGGCLRRVIALHIGVDRITRLRPQHPGVVDLRRARSSCRVARR